MSQRDGVKATQKKLLQKLFQNPFRGCHLSVHLIGQKKSYKQNKQTFQVFFMVKICNRLVILSMK